MNETEEPAAGSFTTILMLNHDCLLHLCQYLSPLDIIRLGQTCNQFKSLVEDHIYPKYSSLDLDNLPNLDTTEISLEDVESISKAMAQFIQKLHSSRYNITTSCDNIFRIMSKYLINLQEIYLENFELNEAIREYSVSFTQVKLLNLKWCQGFGDAILQLMPNIVDLHLQNINDCDGSGFIHLKDLQKLSIVECENLTLKGAVSSNLKSLKYLYVGFQKCWPLDTLDSLKSLKTLKVAHSNLPSLKVLADRDQLEELDIRCCWWDCVDQHQCLHSFTKLKVLKLNYLKWTNQGLLLRLAEKLDLMTIGCNGVQLTDEATVQLVKYSKNLNLFQYDEAAPMAIKKIIELVNDDRYRPKLVVVIDKNQKTELLCGTYDRVMITFDLPKLGANK